MDRMSENEVKMRLKIMVDSKAKKVVFAEAGKDFVDFLFRMLSLPLATVVKLLNNEEMTGSLPALYKSVESLETPYFEQNVNKYTVLMPKLPISIPLLSLDHNPDSLTHFKCPDHNYVSDCRGETCSFYRRYPHGKCYQPMSEVKFTYVTPTSQNKLPGFVKEAIPFIVMDNLEVNPMSMTLFKSFFSDFDSLVQEEVKLGLREGLALLKASLETNNVLTTVFLGSKNETSRFV